MSNEVPNTNDVTCVANIMLNEVPNSSDAMHVASSALNYNGCTTILIGGCIAIVQKSRLTRDER